MTTQDMRVIIALNGQNYTFDQANGQDQGTYANPQGRFEVGNVLVTNPALPNASASFRRDADGSRDEVVVELGNPLAAAGQAADLGAYSAQVIKGSLTLATVSVPGHWWSSRWRWQSSLRPVTATAAQLAAAGLLPNFNPAVTQGKTVLAPVYSYTPMTLAGIYPNMTVTGERPDIGFVTEYQGQWASLDDSASLGTLLAQLEGSGTLPWHLRDPNTGAPLDFNTYSNMTLYSPAPRGTTPIPVTSGSGTKLSSTHEPALAAVPFMLTGDPYALEELQFAGTFNVFCDPPSARSQFGLQDAPRALAWNLRTWAQLARLTPANVPGWLKPQSYWQAQLNAARDWLLASFVNNPAPEQAIFQVVGMTTGRNDPPLLAGTFFDPWQQDFLLATLGMIVRMGFTDWAPILAWKAQQAIVRATGPGWNPSVPTLYELALRPTMSDPVVADWAGAWALNQQLQPGKMVPPGPDITYLMYLRGALALAADAGVAGASAAFGAMDQLAAGLMNSSGQYKWAWVL